MKNIKLFEKEINNIQSEDLRMFVRFFLEEYTPDYFWTEGASSSGKYHPKFSQGIGGLVRHTKAVCMFNEELLRMSSYAYMRDEYKDYTRIACICHDTAKYGLREYDKKEYPNHAQNAADLVAEAWREYFHFEHPSEAHFLLLNAIASHMGQWSTDKEDKPFTNLDRCVHMADYMASRPFIDIPEITEEYMALACEYASENRDEPLPF